MTALQELARRDASQHGVDLDQWVSDRLADDRSYPWITRQLSVQFGVAVSEWSLRRWYPRTEVDA